MVDTADIDEYAWRDEDEVELYLYDLRDIVQQLNVAVADIKKFTAAGVREGVLEPARDAILH